jgi:hypothetical protein
MEKNRPRDRCALQTGAFCSAVALLAMFSLGARASRNNTSTVGNSQRDLRLEHVAPSIVTTPPDCPLLGGCEAWSTAYDGPANGLDTSRNFDYAVHSVVLSPDDSRVFEIGYSWGGDPASGGTHYDFITIAHDATTGSRLWTARYNGPGNSQDQALSIAASPDGRRVYVTGTSIGDGTSYDYATVAYDAASGAQLWVSRYNGSGNAADQAWSLAVSPDGRRVFVTGYSWGGDPAAGGTHYDYATVAYDADTGSQLWVTRYNSSSNKEDRARWIAVSPDGERVYVTGKSVDLVTDADYATIAYNAVTGDQIWAARYDGAAGYDEATQVAVDPDGNTIYVTGQSTGIRTSSDYATVSYDASTGAERWAARYDGGDPLSTNIVDVAQGLAVSHDGHVYVTGYSNNDYATVAYDATTGAQQWVARFDGNAPVPLNDTDEGFALVVSPDNSKVYITGTSFSENTNWDIVTIGYDATTGAQQWVTRFDGTEHFQDAAFGLALSRDGSRLYVQGESWHNTTSGTGDLATVAYFGIQPPLLILESIVSRKAHGAAGIFDVDLPLSGQPGVECRSGGSNGDHTMIFTFSNPLTSVASATVTSGTGQVHDSAIDATDPHNYIVNLTGLTNAQRIAVSLTNVTDSMGNSSSTVSASMGVLVGDVSDNGVVSNTDVASVKAQVAAPVTASNFRNDVNANGTISNSDVSATKAQVGTMLP